VEVGLDALQESQVAEVTQPPTVINFKRSVVCYRNIVEIKFVDYGVGSYFHSCVLVAITTTTAATLKQH
jgi:hypothetical protein